MPYGALVIRALEPTDAAAYQATRLRALREDPDAFLSSYEEEQHQTLDETRARIETLRAAGGAIFGAFDGDRLVGLTGLAPARHQKARHRITVWGVWVEAAARRRGLSRALLEAALADARGRGFELAELTVATTMTAARALYEKAGFLTVATLGRAMKVEDRYIDEVMMVLDLRAYRRGDDGAR